MKKFVRPFLIATLCFNSFSMIPHSSINIDNISLVYANENNSQVKLSNNSVVKFSNPIEEKTYNGAIQLEQDTRNNTNSTSNNFDNNLKYSLNIVEVPNNTTLSFDATSGIYLQQVTPQKSENLIFWSNEAEGDDFKFGQLINQEDNSYYFGLYNWLLASEDEKENIAIKYNLGDLNEDDLNITLDWFESKQCDTVFKLNERNFSAVYNNLLDAYNPITSENNISINLPDGTYYIYNTNSKLSTQESTYLDDTNNTYLEINYNFNDTNDLKENALILVVGSGVNTPVSIEKVKNVSISENKEIQEESANTLTATKVDITEKGSDDLNLEDFIDLNIVEVEEIIKLVEEEFDEEELAKLEFLEELKDVNEVKEIVTEFEEFISSIDAIDTIDTIDANNVNSSTPTEPLDSNGKIPDVLNSTDELYNVQDVVDIEDNEDVEDNEDSKDNEDVEDNDDIEDSKDNDDIEDNEDNEDNKDVIDIEGIIDAEAVVDVVGVINSNAPEPIIFEGQLYISSVNSNTDDEKDKDDEKENSTDDGKTIKTNSEGIKIAVEKDTSYTYVVNDDTMDEADFKIVDFGDEDFEVYTSTTIMPELDFVTVYDSNNQPKIPTITNTITKLVNTQASSQIIKDLEETTNKDEYKTVEQVESKLEEQEDVELEKQEVKDENAKVVTTHIYMRIGPDQNYDSIKILAPGQQVIVLEVYENGWNKINFNNQIGYVYGQYLK